MDAPPPAPWTFAARAGYFGDRVCPFCNRRNPAGAKFCNDCGSPLDLKPCNQCDAVNDQAATTCYKCGAQCPASFTTPDATPLLAAADPAPAWATPGDAGVAATVTQPPFAVGALRANWRLAAIATMLIAGVYAAYRINGATPDVMEVASQPIHAGEHNAPTAASVVPMVVESKPVEPETTAALQVPIPTTDPKAPKRASASQRQVPVPATKRASVRQRPVSELQAPEPWQAMHVSLARCGGDLIARILCDQRVRRRFCEGHWGEAPECGSGVVNDHGQ